MDIFGLHFQNKHRRFWVLFAGLFISYLVFLGARPFDTPDEGRYVQMGMEMAGIVGTPSEITAPNPISPERYSPESQSSENALKLSPWDRLITPRLNGIKYFEKPPFIYWMLGIAAHFGGTSEFVMRLVPALLGLAGLLGMFHFVRLLFDRRTAWHSCLVLGTSLLYFALSRVIILDMGLSVMVTMALFATMVAFDPRYHHQRWRYQLLIYVFIALGVMTKGLVALVLTGLIIVLWMVVCRRWDVLSLLYWLPGILLFTLVAVPWHVLAALANPEFLNFYFIHEHFARYTSHIHGRAQPLWFFLPVLIGGFFPWIQFLPGALKRPFQTGKSDPHVLFLLIWASAVIFFFSLSGSKLIPYILPAMPPLGILIARHMQEMVSVQGTDAVSRGTKSIATKQVYWFVGILGIFLVGFLGFILYSMGVTALLASPLLLSVMGILAGGIAVSLWRQKTMAALHQTMLGVVLLFYPVVERVSVDLRRPSFKPVVTQIDSQLTPQDQVMMFGRYYYELPVYFKRRIPIIHPSGELLFGVVLDDAIKDTVVKDEAALQRAWQGPGKVYLFLRAADFGRLAEMQLAPAHIFVKHGLDIVVTNQK